MLEYLTLGRVIHNKAIDTMYPMHKIMSDSRLIILTMLGSCSLLGLQVFYFTYSNTCDISCYGDKYLCTELSWYILSLLLVAACATMVILFCRESHRMVAVFGIVASALIGCAIMGSIVGDARLFSELRSIQHQADTVVECIDKYVAKHDRFPNTLRHLDSGSIKPIWLSHQKIHYSYYFGKNELPLLGYSIGEKYFEYNWVSRQWTVSD